MKTKLFTLLVILTTASVSVFAKQYGIYFGKKEVTSRNASDIFGDGKARFDAKTNTLTLQDGFKYSLSKGLVTIQTHKDLHIVLKGNAEIKAAVRSNDNLIIETEKNGELSITSNISGSALECPNLNIAPGVTLKLLSRNSQKAMHALKCTGTLDIDNACFKAEVTTADLAVAVKELKLNGVILISPKGGFVDETMQGICYGDGMPARRVSVVIDDKKNDSKE